MQGLMTAGGGLSNSKLEMANAALAEVLAGKTFYAGDKVIKTGTMPNRGAWGATYAGEDVTIPDGYHNGSGKVVVDGGNKGAWSSSVSAGSSINIPKGWHNGSGKVTANSLASQTDANAADGDILTGKTAWVKGAKITGTMANRGAPNQTLGIGGSYSLSAGYYSGGKISAKGSFSGSGSSGDRSGDYSEIYRDESNRTREIQARSHASASISGKTVTITVHAEAYQRANDIPSLSGTKSSVDYSFSFNIG